MNRPVHRTPPRKSATRTAGAAMLACAALAAVAGPAEGRPPVSFVNEEIVPEVSSIAPAATGATAPFARVRYQEGGVESRQGNALPQAVDVNYPVFAGERITTDSGQRVELQLPDGTMLRIDRDSEVMFDDFAALDGGTSVVALASGQVQLMIGNARGGDGLRIDTPSASIYPLDASNVRVDVEPGDAVRVSVASGRVEVAAERGSVVVVSGERTAVAPGAAPRDPWRYAAGTRDSFDGWAAQRDRDDPSAVAASEVGVEFEALPEEVQPYYGELSQAGQWVYTEDYGWALQPNVGSDWQPYQNGEWYPSPAGDPVWVGAEPWGWATWRYGSWDFNLGVGGWIWVPGAVWGPANVWWYYGPSYVGWVPNSYWGWPVYGWYGGGYWGSPWFDYCPWTFVGYDDFWHGSVPRAAVSRDRILKPELDRGVVSREAIPAPDDRRARAGAGAKGERREALDRGVYDRARTRAERGDRAVRPVPRSTVEDEMRRERGADAPGQRSGGGQGATAPGRRESVGRRGGEGTTGHVKPPGEATPPRGGERSVTPRLPRSPASAAPSQPSAPRPPRAPRRSAPDGAADLKPGVTPGSRGPGSSTVPARQGAMPRAPRTFPRAPEGGLAPRAPRDGESVRRFFGRLSEENRGAPVAPRTSPIRPGSGPTRSERAAPAPRAPRPQAGSPGTPSGRQAPRAPAAGSRSGSGNSGKPPAAAPRPGSGGSAPRSGPAPRSGGSSAPHSSGSSAPHGSSGRSSGSTGHSTSPRR